MPILLAILATLAAGVAALAITWAVGARVPPVVLALAALAILVVAGVTLVTVVARDIHGPAASAPDPASRVSGG